MFGTYLINTIRKERYALRPYTINKSWGFCYPKTMWIKPNKRAIRVKYIKKDTLTSALFVIRLGLEPKTPTLKVLCSTSWASGSSNKAFFVLRVQRYILLANLANKLHVFYPPMPFYLVLGICFCWCFGGFGLNIHLFFGNISLPVGNDKGGERQGNDNPNET